MIVTPEQAQKMLTAAVADIANPQTRNTVGIAGQVFAETIEALRQSREHAEEMRTKLAKAEETAEERDMGDGRPKLELVELPSENID